MGDKSGVRVRSESSIEIDFYYRNVRCRERIKLNPTPRNIAYCTKLKARIEHEIGTGEFDYKKALSRITTGAVFLKNARRCSCSIQDYLESWLATEKAQHQTLNVGRLHEDPEVSPRADIWEDVIDRVAP